MPVPKRPAVFVMESPTAREYDRTARSHRCLTCREFFKLSQASYRTAKQLRERHELYLIVCYGCYQDLASRLRPGTRPAGRTTEQARTILGLP